MKGHFKPQLLKQGEKGDMGKDGIHGINGAKGSKGDTGGKGANGDMCYKHCSINHKALLQYDVIIA